MLLIWLNLKRDGSISPSIIDGQLSGISTHYFLKATQFFWSGLWLLKPENHLRSQVA